MAEGKTAYGRSTKAGTGTTISQAYEFGPRSSQSYLSGGLAGEYAAQKATLGKGLHADVSSKAASRLVQGEIEGKIKAKKSLGKLREIAQANAVGSFLSFAHGMGRGSMARASKGLLTPEAGQAPDTAGVSAQVEGPILGWGRHQQNLRKTLGKNYAASTGDVRGALEGLSLGGFEGGGALSYQQATGTGQSGIMDPRAQMYSKFQQLKTGATTPKAAFGILPELVKGPRKSPGGFMRGRSVQTFTRPEEEPTKVFENPQALYYQRG